MHLVVALLVALAACETASPRQARGVAVKVTAAERSSRSLATRYSAQIVPQTRVDLAFKVGGYVDKLALVQGVDGELRAVQEGDPIEKGAVLASIRPTDYAQKVAEARAGVAQAASTYRNAKTEHGRDSKLFSKDSLPEAALDASRGRRDGARAALEGAQVKLAQAKTALGDTRLVAPMSGVVIKRAVEVGALVAPGTPAFSIADVSSVKAVFGVPDTLLARIQLGATLKVTSEAIPGVELAGKVTRLSPSADPKSRVFDVDVTIPNEDGQLKAGMVVALSLDGGTALAGDPLLIPLTAVVRGPGGKGFAVYVVTATNGVARVQLRAIELGEYLGRLVPVTKGLVGDERVVTLGADLLSDGERIEIIP